MITTIDNKQEFLIPEGNLGRLENSLVALNKKALKLLGRPIVIEKLAVEYREAADGFVTAYHKILVVGAQPVIGGWTFIATLQHTENGNVVRSIQGLVSEGGLVAYRNNDPVCDHCQTHRRRKDTYLVRNEQGALKQVGKSCLKDFIGHDDPMAVAALLTHLIEFEAECRECEESSGGGGAEYMPIEHYLRWVSACIRQCGWVSRSKAAESCSAATAVVSASAFAKPSDFDFEPNDADAELVVAALKWVREEADTTSDYMYNLYVACKQFFITHRDTGIVASLIVAYSKHRELMLQKKREAEATISSEWQGTVGKRETFLLTCMGVRFIEGQFGRTALHKLIDRHGNAFTWFASGDCLEADKEYQIKATVKSHDEYQGTRQTVITRCKVQ